MTDDVNATAPSGPITVIPAPEPSAPKAPINIRDAASALARARYDKKDEPAPVEATPEESPPERVEDDSPETAPVEISTEEDSPEAETLPPVDAPRSWTKEDKETFRSLPRETQERIAERERSRERDFLQRQNEATEKLKGLTAKEQAVEQARQQYDAALPILLQNLQSGMQGEFADITSMADVQNMARTDWPRYIRWDAQQKQVAAVQQELLASKQRQEQERTSKWSEYATEQDSLLAEKAPELADREKGQKIRDAALEYLKDVGFAEKELASAWRGEAEIPFRDHRVQLLILDGIKYRQAQARAKTVQAKPLPPVQRPGVSQPKAAAQNAVMETLGKKLDNARNFTQGAKIAAEMLAARRQAAARQRKA